MRYITYKIDNMSADRREVIFSESCPSDYGLLDDPQCVVCDLHVCCEECWKRALDMDRDAVDISKREEEKNMKVEVVKKMEVELQEYWVLRGIKNVTLKYNYSTVYNKEVVVEKEMSTEPTQNEIAEFLLENQAKYGISFVSVEHNYRLVD